MINRALLEVMINGCRFCRASFIPFVVGLGAIFVSGGNMMYMIVGDALVLLAGIAFLKVLK
ncbi:MAG: hypothetical protein WBL87_10045 [Methanothrix sp.]